MEKRIVILGAGESGAGAAILAHKLGFDTFVSDFGKIGDKYKVMLDEKGKNGKRVLTPRASSSTHKRL